jgi:hypothetical protein
MRAKVSSTHRGCIPRWRLLGWEGLILSVVAAWLFTSCVSMQAEDPKPDQHPQTAAVQQNAPTTKDSKKKIANAAVSATCKIKSDDSAIVTNPGEVASPGESDGQEQISKASTKASSRESLTLQAPSREEWTKDEINASGRTTSREESRSDKSENPKPGSDLKCTPHEAASKTESTTIPD